MRNLAALLLLCLAGCGRSAKAVKGVDALLSADAKVEIFRIAPPAPPAPPAGEYVDWTEIAGPVPVPASTAAALIALLEDPASYQDIPKPCLPVPGIKLRFTRASGRADIAFCFECGVLIAYRDGRHAGGGDFDPAARAFARLFKPLFPNDAVVQGLKE